MAGSNDSKRHSESLRLGLALAFLAITLLFASVSAAEEAGIRIRVSSVSVSAGSSSEVEVSMEGEAGTAAIAFIVDYDASKLVLDSDPVAGSKVEIQAPSHFQAASWVGSDRTSLGVVIFPIAKPLRALQPGPLARLRFRTLSSAIGLATIRLRDISAADGRGKSVNVTDVEDGGITVSSSLGLRSDESIRSEPVPSDEMPAQNPSHSLILPAAIRFDDESARWRSSLDLFNAAPNPAAVRLILLPSSPGAARITRDVLLEPAASTGWSDVIRDLFGIEEARGALLVESRDEIVARSSTYQLLPNGGRLAQSIPVIPLDRMFRSGDTAHLIGLERSDGRTTNVTIVNLGFAAATFELELLDAAGKRLGVTETTVPPGQSASDFPLLSAPGLAGRSGLAMNIRSLSDGALFFSYASTVDQRSGSPLFQSAR
ncbi:MAG TPA: hypothetical protein VM557_14095 [Thermoanaerobaculia bacterium]|nr:hypothetical protein [Thermoanaerobaculia bacterium]